MSVSLTRLPSLDLVRGFVAVGRRMSITLAAQDLCLTQSAISRQIHALEDTLGVKLFSRGYRSIQFTPEGERLFRIADVAVQHMQDVLGALDTRHESPPVTITTSTGVASLWLLPRLTRFQLKHPHIDVRVTASNKILDLRAEGVDLAIRYCTASSAPPDAIRLFGERLVAVCHPSLKIKRLDLPDTLKECVLLEFDEPRRPWLLWADRLNALGLGAVKPKAILRFNQYDQVIQAAAAGQGIALGRIALVDGMLKDGRLSVIPHSGSERTSDYGYWLVQSKGEQRRNVRAVAEWIRHEGEAVDVAMTDSEVANVPSSEKSKLTSVARSRKKAKG